MYDNFPLEFIWNNSLYVNMIDLKYIYLYKGKPFFWAPALQIAKETPKIAFAPSLDLFGVPSSFSMRLSMSVCCVTSKLALKIKAHVAVVFINHW